MRATTRLKVSIPHPEAVGTEVGRDDLEVRIDTAEGTPELTFSVSLWSAQDREASTFAARSVNLPAHCAARHGKADSGFGVCATDAGVKATLRLGVVGQGLSEPAEVRLEERIARRFGGSAQFVELGSVWALLS